ncbi:MAG TPA: heparan-alpha-glucosaminide N-acetyltransferase domain-containing protein [Chloroflexota bacterium]|nr:heparan-alpha-glucosaminide N-acetyltransferase domain-containing protein [Chloroflexota bacterium]
MATVTVQRPSATLTARLVSLDVLRGITIAFMILVNNNGGHAWWPFNHSDWNGWTPTDLVFPTFLFVVGVTTVLSLESRLNRGATPGSQIPHIVRRFVLLFLFGLFVNGFPTFPWAHLRIYGVLQRIAICYLLASLLWLAVRKSARRVAILAAICAVCLVGYYILMRWVPVPGYGVPGRDIPLLDKNLNLVAWLDRHIFPAQRLYERVRDPEGLLSDIPSLATTMLGMLTAVWLRTDRTIRQKCAGILAAGVVCILMGELWNPWFPINKKLWTSSYVLFAGGCSLLIWALCIWLIDMKGWKKGWAGFWLVFGTNAIFAYVLSEALGSLTWFCHVGRLSVTAWCYTQIHTVVSSPGGASLIYSISFVLVCWLLTLPLYRKKIFLKL